MSLNIEKEFCYVCQKSVYMQDKLVADSRIYHKACFRCKKCGGVLKLGNYASMDGEVFCKVCFKKNFFTKGNYSEGFGKLKPQEQHDLKTGRTVVLPVSSSFRGFDQLKQERNRSDAVSDETSPVISEFEDVETKEQLDAKEKRRMELLDLEHNRKKQMEEDIRKREERKRLDDERLRESKKQEFSKIEEQRKSKVATEQKEEEERSQNDQIKRENRRKELALVEENRKKLEEQKLRDDVDRKEREKKQREESEEKKKQMEAYRALKEKEDTKKREEAEQARILKERTERKRLEEDQMREDEERRKKVLEETVFASKSDIKFTKPTIGGRGNRRLTPANSNPTTATPVLIIGANSNLPTY